MTTFLKPIGAWANIRWKDEAEDMYPENRYFSFGKVDNSTPPDIACDTYGVADDDIFFYCTREDMEEDNFEFIILGYQPVYNYESTPTSINHIQAETQNITEH